MAGRDFQVRFIGDTSSLNKSLKSLQKSTGAVGKSVSMTGSMMRTAFAGLSVAGVVGGMKSAVMAASTLNESVSKSQAVFGKSSAAIEAWSKTTATSLGLSSQQALEAASTYGNLFRAFGLGTSQAQDMSKNLVILAADLASFNNTSVDDALLALRSGLSGETEPLKRFGIAINDARLKEQALAMGLIKTTKGTLPIAIKTQAAYALIMKDSALAQGDVARTSGGLANQMRFLKAGVADASANFGQLLLPAVLNLVKAINQSLFPALDRIRQAFEMKGAVGGFDAIATEISKALTSLDGAGKKVYDFITLLAGVKIAAAAVTYLRAQWIAVSVAETAAATASVVAAGVMKAALISTGWGALIVALGFVISKLIEAGFAAKATGGQAREAGKSFDYMTYHATSGFMYVQTAAAAAIPTIDAVALAATRAGDALDFANAKRAAGNVRVKKAATAYKATHVPTPKIPSAGGGAAGSGKKAAKAASAVAEANKKAAAAIDLMNKKLTAAKDKLTAAKDAYNSFKTSVNDAIVGFIDFSAAATAETGSFLSNLQKQATQAAQFGSKVQQLLSMGLSESALSQVLSAGADAGTKIADEIIRGGASAVSKVNELTKGVQDLAAVVAKAAADKFYQAGITQGQAMVAGITAAIKKAGFIISGGEVKLPSKLSKALESGKMSKKQQKQLDKILKASAKVKASTATQSVLAPVETVPQGIVANQSAQPVVYNINVATGIGDPATIGKQVVETLVAYNRRNGAIPVKVA